MSIEEIIVISVGVAMDAFAVSICKGLKIRKMNLKKSIIIALYLGGAQAFFFIIGYYLGISFSEVVNFIDHWIAFILLSVIGINMIKESFNHKLEKDDEDVSLKTMGILAMATSIDAFAVGVTFAFFNTDVMLSSTLIGTVTFILSMIGVKVGNKFGDIFQNKAELIGGITLILIGGKILLEHLGGIKL